GANYFHCGAYRPSFDCKMRNLSAPFCAVCRRVIRETLTPLLPDGTPLLMTPSIDFHDVPEGGGGVGITTYRAVVFELDACMAASRHLHITDGPTNGFHAPLGDDADLETDGGGAVATARIWISYTSGAAGSSASGTVTIHCDETGDDFVVPLSG